MSINVRSPTGKAALQNSYGCCLKINKHVLAHPKPSKRSTRHQIQAKWSTSSTLAGPLLAVALSLAPPAHAAETKATVPLNRDIVETMLMQRLKERIQGMSDAELAQVTERLLAENAAFPIDLVSAPPTRAQIAPPPPPPPFLLPQEAELEEEDADDTAELLKALQSAVKETATEAVSSSSPQSILDAISPGSWGPKAATAARAIGIGAGVAAAAAIGLRKQPPAAEQQPGQSNETPRQPKSAVETSSPSTEASGGWLGRLFVGKEAEKDVAAPVGQSSGNGALPAEEQVESVARPPSLPPPPQFQPRRPPSSGSGPPGGVLWQRSGPGEAGDFLPAAPPSDQVQVLWRRREEAAGGGGGPPPQQQGASDRDLWRMPMEELQQKRGGDGGENEPAAAEGMASGSRTPRPPRLRPNALDNAETAV